MKQHNLLIPVPYYYFTPRRCIIGIREAPGVDAHHPERVLRKMHEHSPGWSSLALCEQRPVMFGRGNLAHIVATVPGEPSGDAPPLAWYP